ncbi:MAG: hypothetical protein NUW01_17465 [Gemmatimonadaceae bacterium]|nr:hypothetical protein [Gemmatimonadaceae bacterium]
MKSSEGEPHSMAGYDVGGGVETAGLTLWRGTAAQAPSAKAASTIAILTRVTPQSAFQAVTRDRRGRRELKTGCGPAGFFPFRVLYPPHSRHEAGIKTA